MPTCSTGSLAGSLPNMAITSVANTFSVTFCRSLVGFQVNAVIGFVFLDVCFVRRFF